MATKTPYSDALSKLPQRGCSAADRRDASDHLVTWNTRPWIFRRPAAPWQRRSVGIRQSTGTT